MDNEELFLGAIIICLFGGVALLYYLIEEVDQATHDRYRRMIDYDDDGLSYMWVDF